MTDSKHQTVGATISSTSADGSATVVYTTPSSYKGAVRYLHVSNNNSATKKVKKFNTTMQQASTTYHYIAKDLSMSANSVTNLANDGALFTHEGDKIVAFGETANTIEVLVSVEEFLIQTEVNNELLTALQRSSHESLTR